MIYDHKNQTQDIVLVTSQLDPTGIVLALGLMSGVAYPGKVSIPPGRRMID